MYRPDKKLALPKPFERDYQLGWGKRGECQLSSKEDSHIYDFHDEIDIDNDPAGETPWSMQKKKKEKIKKNYTRKRKPKQDFQDEIEDCCEILSTDKIVPNDVNKSSKMSKNQNLSLEDSISDVVVEESFTRSSRRKKTLTTETISNKKEITKSKKTGKKKNVSMKKTVVEKCAASLASIVAGFEEKERLAEQKQVEEDEGEKKRMVQSQESNVLGTISINLLAVLDYIVLVLFNFSAIISIFLSGLFVDIKPLSGARVM